MESGEKYKVQQIHEAESAKVGHRRVVSFGNTGQKDYRAINIRKVTCNEQEGKGNCKVSRANSHGLGNLSANGLAHVSSRFK